MKDERTVGSLRCGEVLERLADYLDGTLAPEEVARVDEHLQGCDNCASFGGVYEQALRALRERLSGGGAPPADVLERLRQRLHEERGG